MTWWLLACVASSRPEVLGEDSGVLEDSGRPSVGPWPGLGDGAPPCPEGMVLVEGELQAFCIDRYEVQLDEEGLRRSVEGVLPTVGISFREARAACEALGRRMATTRQWEDAGDGQLGEGGSAYVYGDDYDASVCNDPDSGHGGLLPTGSLPGCVSAFGTFDQCGNAWEWTDPEVDLDAHASPELWAETFELSEGGRLRVLGSLDEVQYEAAGWTGEFLADEEGLLVMEVSEVGPTSAGYLIPMSARDVARAWLPVDLFADEPGRVDVLLAIERDGDPMTDKRGGAWYSGGSYGSQLHSSNYVHDADFEGSIGFRCVAEPWL